MFQEEEEEEAVAVVMVMVVQRGHVGNIPWLLTLAEGKPVLRPSQLLLSCLLAGWVLSSVE